MKYVMGEVVEATVADVVVDSVVCVVVVGGGYIVQKRC